MVSDDRETSTERSVSIRGEWGAIVAYEDERK
jgi:hypothetical protein